jgi:hypothetical protein
LRRLALGLGGAILLAGAAGAQNPAADADRAAMMRALGITALLPGASGDPTQPDHANEDERQANPLGPLPDPLRFADGRRVANTADWQRRRAEIAEVYAREVYGRVPAGVPAVDWQVTATDREMIGYGRAVVARRVIGTVAAPGDPARTVRLRMTVVLPADAKAPVPVLVMLGRSDFPAPSQPSAEEFDRINAAARAALVREDPGLAAVFARHQAFSIASPAPFRMPERDAHGDPPPPEQLIAAGWGYALLDPTSAQGDDGAALRSGIIGLVNRGGPRKPDDWGALRAWAWAASRAFDWLARDPAVDARRIGVEGVSRYGKAALVAMAYDERFAVGLIGSSGKGGATPLRRNFGEGVGNLATGEYHWMAGNFLKYDTKGVSAPGLDAGALPVDSNALIALAAPRPLFISYGVPAAGDAAWLDQRGSWMATVDAARVYRLLGEAGPASGDAMTVPMPAVNEDRLAGALAWRQHDGGHTDAPNFKAFLGWADRVLAER